MGQPTSGAEKSEAQHIQGEILRLIIEMEPVHEGLVNTTPANHSDIHPNHPFARGNTRGEIQRWFSLQASPYQVQVIPIESSLRLDHILHSSSTSSHNVTSIAETRMYDPEIHGVPYYSIQHPFTKGKSVIVKQADTDLSQGLVVSVENDHSEVRPTTGARFEEWDAVLVPFAELHLVEFEVVPSVQAAFSADRNRV